MDNSISDLFASIFDFLLFVIPVIVPFFLLYLLIQMWVNFARKNYMNSKDYVLLEVVPPIDILKSPAAMELFLHSLYQTQGEANWIDKYWSGKMRPWFSLEIASFGGKVHFFIWMERGGQKYIETQLFAQYPGIEAREVDDYTNDFVYDPSVAAMWGVEFGLTAPDPFPIKTYVDYGLDKETEEDFKVDPITSFIEFMGSLPQGNQIWFQIIIKAHKKEDKDPAKWFGKTDKWQDEAKTQINKIRDESITEVDEAGGKTGRPNPTKGQQMRIEALERSVSKLSFDVGIRGLYLADKDVFDPSNIGGLVSSLKQYGSSDLNGFKPALTTGVNFPWQDYKGIRVNAQKEEILGAYRERAYFMRPYKKLFSSAKRTSFVLNVEELATIYHFPGRVSQSPGLKRIESRKAMPPENLPT